MIHSPAAPVTGTVRGGEEALDGVLELADGSAFRGISFGAQGKSISGECVFQTGMCKFLIDFLQIEISTSDQLS